MDEEQYNQLTDSDKLQYDFLQGVISETLLRAVPLIMEHVFPTLQGLAALHDGDLDHQVVLREVQRSIKVTLLGIMDTDTN